METQIDNNRNYTDKLIRFVKEKKKFLIIIIVSLIGILICINIFHIYKDNKHKEVSAKFIQAGLLLGTQNKEKANELYQEIILSKNKFYAILSLNTLIENDLENDKNKILNFFEIIQNIKLEREEKNLIKLKKALFLIKISQVKEGNELLKQIVDDNSSFADIALEIVN